MNNSLKRILLTILLVWCGSAMAQTDSSAQNNQTNDSLSSAALREYNRTVAAVEQQRVADSLQRVKLEARLNSLTTTDNLQKEKLQAAITGAQRQGNQPHCPKKGANRLAPADSQGPTLSPDSFGDTLFLIYSKLGSFSAKDRAEAISNRIEKLRHATDSKLNNYKSCGRNNRRHRRRRKYSHERVGKRRDLE